VALHALILFTALTPWAFQFVSSDIAVYFRDASLIMNGAIPYRDYLVEYPPMALPLFVIPRLFTNMFAEYVVLFGAQMLLFDATATYLVVRRLVALNETSAIPWRLAWYSAFVAALYPFSGTRYDWAPMAVAFAAALMWFSGRSALGGAVAAIGALIKIFPGFIAGPAFIWEAVEMYASRLRGTVSFAVTLALGITVWALLGMGRALQYHLSRGLEIETIWAGVLMAIAKVTGAPLGTEWHSGSLDLLAHGAREISAVIFPIQGVVELTVLWRFWRSGLQDPLRYVGASILAIAITGKILSPQYLIWVIPFVTVLNGRAGTWGRWIFLFACIATTAIYPWNSGRLVAFDAWTIGLLNSRNASLVALLALCLLDPGISQKDGRGSRPARQAPENK